MQGHAEGSPPRASMHQQCPLHGRLVTVNYRLIQRLSS